MMLITTKPLLCRLGIHIFPDWGHAPSQRIRVERSWDAPGSGHEGPGYIYVVECRRHCGAEKRYY